MVRQAIACLSYCLITIMFRLRYLPSMRHIAYSPITDIGNQCLYGTVDGLHTLINMP